MRWTAAAIFVVCVEAQTPAQAPLVTVNSIRFWSLGQTTRVAVEMSAEARYKFEQLQNPDRLFLDVQESRSRLSDRQIHFVKVGDKLVKQVRVAQKDPNTTRVVLDLEGPVEHEISQLANPSRIIIEVRAPGSKGKEASITQSRTGAEKIEPGVPADSPRPEQPKPELAVAAPAPPPVAGPASTAGSKPAAPAPPPVAGPAPTAGSKPAVTEESALPFRARNYEPIPTAPTKGPDVTPRPARPTSVGTRSLTRALGLKIGRVVLDPGHGGNDHGTTGPTGLTEKELVLDVALRLGALIEQRMGSEVVYTRRTDEFIPLDDRTLIANQNRADLFLSIHANSSPLRAISGAEVYYLNFSTSRDALDVAARENAGHGKSIFELRELIQKIALKDKLDESREFAARVQTSLSSTWSKMNTSAKNRGVKKAPFVVLIGATMPSVLAEVGFISNTRDESMLRKPDQRQRIAEALYKGIEQYAASLGQVRAAQGQAPGAAVQSSR